MAKQFANERKSTPMIVYCPDSVLKFFFHWQIAQPFAVQDECVGRNECFGIRAVYSLL